MPANPFIATGDELWYDTGSTWRQRRRAWFDGVAVPLVDLGGARAMRWLHWAATTWARTGLEPPTGCDIAALFPDLAPRSAGAIARRSSALLAKNRAAIALVERRGLQALARFVSPASSTSPFDPRGRTGLVIAGFHVGAHFGLGAALARWQVPALMMPAQPLAGVEQRAGSLKRAIDYVRGGGIVLAAVDGPGGLSTDPVPCLGRRIVLRRGPFVLAGRTGAPVVPAVARWTDEGLLDVIVGAPIASAGENSQAAVVARWLETHLLAHPGDLWPYTIRSLLEAPLA